MEHMDQAEENEVLDTGTYVHSPISGEHEDLTPTQEETENDLDNAADKNKDTGEFESKPSVSSPNKKAETSQSKELPSRLPLILGPQLKQDVCLVQFKSSEIDLSGDSGVVGRMSFHEPSKVCVDLKGLVYRGEVAPTNTSFLVVNMGPTEAKVESVIHNHLQLHYFGNVLHMESRLDDSGFAMMPDSTSLYQEKDEDIGEMDTLISQETTGSATISASQETLAMKTSEEMASAKRSPKKLAYTKRKPKASLRRKAR
jgi:hypothetical protein